MGVSVTKAFPSPKSKGDEDFWLEALLPISLAIVTVVLRGTGGGGFPVNCLMGLTGVSSTKTWDCVLSRLRSFLVPFGFSFTAGARGSGGSSGNALDFDRLKPLLMLTSLVNTRFFPFVVAFASASRDMDSERDRASVEAESESRGWWRERERDMEVDVEAVLLRDGSLERDDAAGRVF